MASSHLLTEDLETCYKLHCCFNIAFNSLKVEMIVSFLSFFRFPLTDFQSNISKSFFLHVLCNMTTTPLVSSPHLIQNIVVDHTAYGIRLVSGVSSHLMR